MIHDMKNLEPEVKAQGAKTSKKSATRVEKTSSPTNTVEAPVKRKKKIAPTEEPLEVKNKKNLEKVSQSETVKKGEVSLLKLKYIYPDDCITPMERKAYRAKVRAEGSRLEKAIAKANAEKDSEAKAKQLRKLEKKKAAYIKEHLTADAGV